MLAVARQPAHVSAPPKLFGWASVDCPVVSAVLAPANVPLTPRVYLAYLQDRVAQMLAREPFPRMALVYLADQFQEADLLRERPNLRDPERALDVIIFENGKLLAWLDQLGALPGRVTLDRHSARAAQIVEKTTLEQWIRALTRAEDLALAS